MNPMLMQHARGALDQQLRRIPPGFSAVRFVPDQLAVQFEAEYGPHDRARVDMPVHDARAHVVERVWTAVVELERQALDIISARDGIRDLVDQ